jgi:hypothetical protein
MVLSETLTETVICNRSLGKIGATRINNVETDTSINAIQCRLHYEPTRDALFRSHKWRVARERIRLASVWATAKAYTTDQYVLNDSVWYKCAVAHTSSSATEPPHANWTTLAASDYTPDFEWDFMWDLPSDYLRFRSIDEETGVTSRNRRHAIEGQRFLTDFSTVSLLYIKKVTDVTEFDPLFVEILILQLALRLVAPLAGGAPKLQDGLAKELKLLMPKAQAVDSDETDTGGRSDWNLARQGGLGITGTAERFL